MQNKNLIIFQKKQPEELKLSKWRKNGKTHCHNFPTQKKIFCICFVAFPQL
jgi:hypothetical protein